MKHLGLQTLIVLAVSGVSVFAPAWAASKTTAKPKAEVISWTPLRGKAADLSVGFDGTAFTLDPKSQIWMRRNGNDSWLKLPGRLVRVDAANEKDAWGIAGDGAVYRYNGTWWRKLKNVSAKDVGVGARGTAFAVLDDGSLARFEPSRNRFLTVAGAPTRLSRVDVDDKDRPWVVLADGSAQRFDGRVWIKLPGQLSDIAAGRNQAAFAVSTDQQPLRWNASENRWAPLAARAAVVAIGADGGPWLATPEGEIYAQQPDVKSGGAKGASTTTQVLTQVLGWRKVSGNAVSLTISADGKVAALGPQGEVWQWKGKNNWTRLSGKFKRIAMAPGGDLWGIDSNGAIRQFLGSYWKLAPGSAVDIAIGANRAMWILSESGKLAQWQPGSRRWQVFQGEAEPSKAKRLAVDPDGRPWVIDGSGGVFRYDGKHWVAFPGIEASDLAIGPESTVFAAVDGKPWRYNRLNKRWESLTGEATAIAVGPKGLPWAVSARSEIFATSFFEEEQAPQAPATASGGTTTTTTTASAPAGGSGALATSKEVLGPANFQLVRNIAARNVAIGSDGSVYVITSDSKLARWNNAQNRFLSFPGQFSRVAVAADGRPWGINTKGEVYRHDGIDWRIVRDVTAQDISIGFNGTIIIAAPNEVLYRFNPATTRFDRLLAEHEGDPPPMGSRIAVDPKGKPWTIDKKNRIHRCDRNPCELLPQAALSIAIGPEGSVFIADPDRRLRRYNAATGEWDRVNIDADAVAAGPAGRPWITNNRNEVWASAFFKRDESGDIAKAATSNASSATTSTTPVFTFLLNMTFDTVALPVGFTNNPFPPVVMAFAPTGKLVVIDSAMVFWNYDETQKKFIQDTSVPSPVAALATNFVQGLAISADGTYWLSSDNSMGPPNTLRRQGSQWIVLPELADCGTTPGCGFASPTSVAPGPNGSVYATSQGDNIYRYDTAQNKFVKQAIPLPPGGALKISVDPAGRLWALAPAPPTPRIYEYDGKTWINRSTGIVATLPNLAACVAGALPCTAIGANGSVFSFNNTDPWRLIRWNAASSNWELISTSPTVTPPPNGFFAVAPDGRPWLWNGTTMYRAR